MTPEESLVSFHKAIMEKWVSRDPRALQEMLDFFRTDISFFGTGLHEIANNRDKFAQFMNKEHQEVPESPILELAWLKGKVIDNTGYTWGAFDLKVPQDGQFLEMKNIRMSLTWLKEKDWKVIHAHTSAPWIMQQDGASFPIEELQARNRELEKMVAEKTADLVEKNRELEIEAALERVRAASMTMQHSSQFIEVNKILRNQLETLGLVAEFDSVEILLLDEELEISTTYLTQDLGPNQAWKFEVAIEELPEFRQMYNDWKAIPRAQRKENFAIMEFQGDRLDALMEWAIKKRARTAAEKEAFIEVGKQLKKTGWYGNYAFFRNGAINIGKSHKLSVSQLSIAHRFAATFEQTYIRFLDLQKAEAQAKEAQIETALERVRAASMAMHDSEDLKNVVFVLFEQCRDIELPFLQVWINILNWNLGEAVVYLSPLEESMTTPHKEVLPFSNHPETLANWKKGEEFLYRKHLGKDNVKAYFKAVNLSEKYYDIYVNKLALENYFETEVACTFGTIGFGSTDEASDEEKRIVQRFSKVFEQSYARFLDLQKAEAQAKEAQIETALERVRAKTMAMRKSEELSQVTEAMFKEFQQFNLTNEFTRAAITIIEEDTGDSEMWMTRLGGAAISTRFEFNISDNELWETDFLAIKKIASSKRKEHRNTLIYEGKDWQDLIAYAKEMHWATPAELRMFEEAGITQMIEHYVWFAYGHLGIQVNTPLSDDAFNILQRFAAVFEQTYTRFLDLQKAEAQAKEAHIEAALERVRAKTMAMHKSEELSQVVTAMFKEFQQFDLTGKLTRVLLTIIDDHSGDVEMWMTGLGGEEISNQFNYNYYDNEQLKEGFLTFRAIEKDKRKEFKYITRHEGQAWEDLLAFAKANKLITSTEVKMLEEAGTTQWIEHSVGYAYGSITIQRDKTLSDEVFNILQRFAAVFEQTYTRFLDLQKAEEQAKEAQIEAALERVRAQTMAMHKSEELSKVTEAMFKEFQQFNLTNEFTRATLAIVDEPTGDTEMWMTRLGGAEISNRFKFNLSDNALWEADFSAIKKIEPAKRKEHRNTLVYEGKDWEDLLAYAKEMHWATPTELRMFEEAGMKQMIEHYVWFAYGQMSIQVDAALADEAFNILQRFTAVFEQTYTRFLDLQKAEAQVRAVQIGAAVERVRAKALAMHNSTDILGVAVALRQEMVGLELPGISAATIYLKQANGSIRMWDLTEMIESENGPILSMDIAFKLEDIDDRLWINEVWRSEESYFMTKMEDTQYPLAADFLRQYMPAAAEPYEQFIKDTQLKESWHPVVPIVDGKGRLTVDFLSEPPAIIETILPQMGAAFDLAYTRFEDLQQAEQQTRQIAKIFEENQRLLHSILPEPIAEQIRKGEQTVVKRFEQVSILFADIVGFTILSEKLSPQKVVDILNGLFSKFDDLTDKYQLEKIKTIGDAYMVASGVPEEKTDHALMLFQFAQDMLQAIQDYNKMHQLELEIRIGICSGPVVAGVIGKKKFAYDLWGDTVNTAARMEAYGKASCIQLAPPSYELLKDDYVFEKIPNVEIKGKGLMDVYVWN